MTSIGLWLKSLLFGLLLVGGELAYLNYTNPPLNLRSVNLAVAGVGLILISLSLFLSGITYFFDFADKQIVYRRYLGVMGALSAGVHVAITLYTKGNAAKMIAYILNGSPAILYGAAALVTLILLTIISNTYSAKSLGNVWWRRILRLGYLALGLTALHMGLLRYKGWFKWLGEPTWPSTSLILTGIVLITFIIRMLLGLALTIKKNK